MCIAGLALAYDNNSGQLTSKICFEGFSAVKFVESTLMIGGRS